MSKKPRRLAFNSTLSAPERPMRKINPKRIAKLRAKQFGENEEKRAWVVSMLCGVSGEEGTPDNPIDPCHVGSPDPDVRGQSTRAAGADDTFLFPMRRLPYHHDFDNLPADKFENLHGVSKQWIREMAEDLDREWDRICTELEAEQEESQP